MYLCIELFHTYQLVMKSVRQRVALICKVYYYYFGVSHPFFFSSSASPIAVVAIGVRCFSYRLTVQVKLIGV